LAADKTENKAAIPVSAIVIALGVIVGFGAFWFLENQSRKGPPPPPPLTGEAKAYVRHLQLSDVTMKAAESYLKQAVVEIEGKVSNQGSRVLKLVEINCVFHDAYGQVVLRERVAIAGRKAGDLGPGETKRFRLAFDNIPESWNQTMPELVIARIVFA
jgi:hypothetical protein